MFVFAFVTVINDYRHYQNICILFPDKHHVIAVGVQGGQLLPSDLWQNHSATSRHSDLNFRFRVTCDQSYYGPGCDVLCRERNDALFGHYGCDVSGKRVCLPGWEGDFCNTGVVLNLYFYFILFYFVLLFDKKCSHEDKNKI